MTVLVAVGMVAVLAGAYFLFGTKKSSADSSVPASAPAAAKSAPAKSSHPFAKYLEIAGLRVKEGARNGLNLQFVVINHSAADLPEMKMNIKVFSDKKDIYDFPFTVPAIGPFESKEFSIPMKTELKPYELPDWQYLNSQFEITSAP